MVFNITYSSLGKSRLIAKRAFLVALPIGIIEILVGLFTLSIALVADGVNSLAVAIIYFIIWIGLRLSGRAPDGTFHFGYYRFETLGSLVAAFLLTGLGGILIYESYLSWLEPRLLVSPDLVLVVALVSAVIGFFVTVYIGRVARQQRSLSLRVGALNGVMDTASSIAVFVSIILNGYFGVFYADAVAGMLIALSVFVMAYSVIKESSLVLVDACRCGDIVEAIEGVVRSVEGVKEVHSVRMRRLGSFIVGDMHVVVSGDMLVREADLIAAQAESKVKSQFGQVIDFKVRIESDEAHGEGGRDFVVKS